LGEVRQKVEGIAVGDNGAEAGVCRLILRYPAGQTSTWHFYCVPRLVGGGYEAGEGQRVGNRGLLRL